MVAKFGFEGSAESWWSDSPTSWLSRDMFCRLFLLFLLGFFDENSLFTHKKQKIKKEVCTLNWESQFLNGKGATDCRVDVNQYVSLPWYYIPVGTGWTRASWTSASQDQSPVRHRHRTRTVPEKIDISIHPFKRDKQNVLLISFLYTFQMDPTCIDHELWLNWWGTSTYIDHELWFNWCGTSIGLHQRSKRKSFQKMLFQLDFVANLHLEKTSRPPLPISPKQSKAERKDFFYWNFFLLHLIKFSHSYHKVL